MDNLDGCHQAEQGADTFHQAEQGVNETDAKRMRVQERGVAVNVSGVNRKVYNWLRGYCVEHGMVTAQGIEEAIILLRTDVRNRPPSDDEELPYAEDNWQASPLSGD